MKLKVILNIIKSCRFFWGKRFVSCERSGYLEDLTDLVYTLQVGLPAGWYMLEMQMHFSNIRERARLYLFEGEKPVECMDFVLERGRIKKRILRVNHSGLKLSMVLKLVSENTDFQHFRLVRISKGFALKRIIKKLVASHPSYREKKKSFIAVNTISSILWEDYCNLFGENAGLSNYQDWISEFDSEEFALNSLLPNVFSSCPLISILMTVCNPNIRWLKQAIDSVLCQSYANWELCIAYDASTSKEVRDLLKFYSQQDDRVKLIFCSENSHISQAYSSVLQMTKGFWFALFHQDDLLSSNALYHVVSFINKNPNATLFYSDEDKIDELNNRFDPYFKSDWNLDLFYSQNMFSHFGVFNVSIVKKVGGFRWRMEGAQDYDLVLRCLELGDDCQICHIPKILYHWRARSGSALNQCDGKHSSIIAGQKALIEHFKRQDIKVNVDVVEGGFYRVSYLIQEKEPLVSIIIPTRNGVYLKRCIESILSETTYSNYEIIIVDNGSDNADTKRFLKEIEKNYGFVSVLHDARDFNYSALNNQAVKKARGDVLALLNDDVVVLSSEWLYEMVSHALRPDVGAVGAKLLYPDNTIQHAGIILGIHGVAGHPHRFLPESQLGYFGRAKLIQSFSAVTGACLVVKKTVYEQVGGLNEQDLQVACNDVDFCLRVKRLGYRNVWTPYALLRHYESVSRGWDDSTVEKASRSNKENLYMRQTWGDLLKFDPAYNPNLSLMDENFSLAWPPRDLMEK